MKKKANLLYMKNMYLILVVLAACTSTPKKSERQKLFQDKQEKLAAQPSAPLKGKFLDYIYEIRPDHKQAGYSIETWYLNDGYAFGTGPYDGWKIEFFLFRGKTKDLVFTQNSGYEVDEKRRLYGFELEVYSFETKKMKKLALNEVLPLAEIDRLYSQKTKSLKHLPEYKDWDFYKYMPLPEVGTTIDIKVCKANIEEPFMNQNFCTTIGRLKWNKTTFILEATKTHTITEQAI
jgi:hypothetical protein